MLLRPFVKNYIHVRINYALNWYLKSFMLCVCVTPTDGFLAEMNGRRISMGFDLWDKIPRKYFEKGIDSRFPLNRSSPITRFHIRAFKFRNWWEIQWKLLDCWTFCFLVEWIRIIFTLFHHCNRFHVIKLTSCKKKLIPQMFIVWVENFATCWISILLCTQMLQRAIQMASSVPFIKNLSIFSSHIIYKLIIPVDQIKSPHLRSILFTFLNN